MRQPGQSMIRLMEKYYPYAKRVVRSLSKGPFRQFGFDELMSYGIEGLIEAAKRFDGSQGTRFESYARPRIVGAVYDGLRREKRIMRQSPEGNQKPLPHLSDYKGAKNEEALVVFEEAFVEDAIDPLSQVDLGEHLDDLNNRTQIRKALKRLPRKMRLLIDLYYFQQKTLHEIGQILNLSKSWVSRLHVKALQLLKQNLVALQGV